jgi:hypothetical protein
MKNAFSRRQFIKKTALFTGAATSLPLLPSFAAETNAPAAPSAATPISAPPAADILTTRAPVDSIFWRFGGVIVNPNL